jgi:hypothetical protein
MIKAGEPVDLAEMVAETWGVDQDSGAILCIGGHEARTLRAESPLFMDTARQHNAAPRAVPVQHHVLISHPLG